MAGGRRRPRGPCRAPQPSTNHQLTELMPLNNREYKQEQVKANWNHLIPIFDPVPNIVIQEAA